jgi:hypothetical protein
MLLFVIVPFALRAGAHYSARSQAEAGSAAAFISLSRSRFFEANLRQSFLAVLSSARGATPAEVAADAAQKLGRWVLVAFEASERRGFSPSLWAGCGKDASQHLAIDPANSSKTFSSLLSFDANRSALRVKYWGNDPATDALGCQRVDIGLGLAFGNDSYVFLFKEGLFAGANRSEGEQAAFGFEG